MHRFFKRFALIDKAGQHAEETGRERGIASEEEFAVTLDRHDDRRIEARIAYESALRASTRPLPFDQLSWGAAPPAEAMRAIPLDHAECPPGQTEGDGIDRFEELTERIEVEIWRRFEIDRHLRRYDIARTNRPKRMRNE
ncbi:MAG: hypothetical protein R2845_04675 [Thermomicrobiales bacterium]